MNIQFFLDELSKSISQRPTSPLPPQEMAKSTLLGAQEPTVTSRKPLVTFLSAPLSFVYPPPLNKIYTRRVARAVYVPLRALFAASSHVRVGTLARKLGILGQAGRLVVWPPTYLYTRTCLSAACARTATGNSR